jgi:hypothetical protein
MNLTNALANAIPLPDLSPLMLDESYLKGYTAARRLALIAADNFEPVKPFLTWGELSKEQQKFAQARHYEQLLQLVAGGLVTFTDPQITEGIALAIKKAEGLQTPWFYSAYIHDEVGDLLLQLVRTEVENCLYRNPEFQNAVSPFDLTP